MIDAKSQIEEELARLLDQQKQILKSLEDIKDIIEFRTVYQRWDTQSLKIVQTLAPDKYDEFVNYFSTNPNRKLLEASIQDYVRGMGQAKDAYTDELPFDPHELARIRFLNQLQVLDELSYRVEISPGGCRKPFVCGITGKGTGSGECIEEDQSAGGGGSGRRGSRTPFAESGGESLGDGSEAGNHHSRTERSLEAGQSL